MSLIKKLLLAPVLALPLITGSCIGPDNAYRSLHHWNSNISNKWVNELVFLGLTIIPVYGIFYMGDIIIFNSIEFWTNDNPISPPPYYGGAEGESTAGSE